MPAHLSSLREELAIANRILAHEGVLDAFGHVSVRHPGDPSRYLLSRSRAPELVQPEDILEFTLDSDPVKPPTQRLYGERVIHGEIYKARPDVHAVVHHHAPAIMPFCVAGVELTPVFHLGAAMGPKVPFWDSRDDFGDTNLLVVKPEEGASLARALGEYWTVLMRRHGATVAGRNLREVVFRTIYGARSAEYQSAAHALGHVGALSPGEIEMAASFNLGPMPVERAWEYWAVRLAKREGRATQTGRPAPARAAAETRKTTAKKAAPKAKARAKRGRK